MDSGEAGLGAGAGGVWTRQQALAVLSPGQVRHRLTGGWWQVLRPGVYADGGVEPSARMRAWAAVLAAGGPGAAWAAGRTSARLLGLPLVDDADPALGREDSAHDDVVVRRAVRSTPTLHVGRGRVDAADLGRIDGCPAVSPVRTLVALAAVLRPDALVCALDHALHVGLVTVVQLDEVLAQRAWWPHVVALRTAVSLADGRAETPIETLGRLVLLPAVPGLVPQLEVFDERTRLLGRLDLGDGRLRLGVEGDGKRAHAGAVMVAKDRRRDARFEAVGWRIERYTWWDVRVVPAALRARVTEQAARRRTRS